MAKSDSAKKKKQIETFRETARALECDEGEGRFDDALKKLGKREPGKPSARPGSRKEQEDRS